MTHRNYPRLWHEPEDELVDKKSAIEAPDNEESLSDMMDRFSSKQPQPRSLLFLLNNSMVVGQEFALTCLLLERHRVELRREEQSQAPMVADDEWRQITSMVLVSITLMIIIFYGEFGGVSRKIRKQQRREKMRIRATDALLLAGILRLLSAVLRTLTASYSSDTVNALAIGGMVVHLFACDYSYANGCVNHQGLATSCHHRPVFQGGTMSLNAALFSTTLLASRLSSNATVYIFISSAISLFAFYPAARHTISTQPHASSEDMLERILFVSTLIFVCVFAPTWKFWLQRHKRIISGPWDIAHVSIQDQDRQATEPTSEEDDSGNTQGSKKNN